MKRPTTHRNPCRLAALALFACAALLQGASPNLSIIMPRKVRCTVCGRKVVETTPPREGPQHHRDVWALTCLCVHELQRQRKITYSEAANQALSSTLVRSLNTSLVAILPVASILFIGTTLLLPRGIVGTINHLMSERRHRAVVRAESVPRLAE